MQTPAGTECKYYYEDFHRGHHVQECRLVKDNQDSLAWHFSDCGKCPVPAILNANANPDLELRLTIESKFFGMKRLLNVDALCQKHQIPVPDAYVGCPQCNEERPILKLFWQALEQDEDTDDD